MTYAAEVYIDQAGSSLNVNVLQENGMNRVNTEADPMIINGDDINVDLTQDGDMNEADIWLEQNANDTNLTYSAVGSFNELVLRVYGGIENTFNTTILGNTNVVTVCKDLYNSTCNGMIVNQTTNTLAITGNNNEVNFALDSGIATNNVTIGANTPSDFNIVNVTQSGAGVHMSDITIDGNNNTVDLVQN
jgi:hypothetical protein